MKTSEQMTREVLARRDKEMKERSAVRHRALNIGIPCAACLAVAAVCTTIIAASGGVGTSESGSPANSSIEIASSMGNEIYFNDINDGEFVAIDIDIGAFTFVPMTLAQLNAYYGVRLTAVGERYPDWEFSNADYGIYTDGGNEVIKENAVSYTSPDDTKSIDIIINKGTLPMECATNEEELVESRIGAGCAYLFSSGDMFRAEFMRNGSGVLLRTRGLSESEFMQVLYDYLYYPDFTNENSGITDTSIIDVDEFNITSVPDPDPNELDEMTVNRVNSFFSVELDRLGIIHPEWTESHDKLGIYRHEESGNGFMAIRNYYTTNTLNYITESGANISVSVQQLKFAPVSDETLTADKPVKIPEQSVITEYDENGNVIGQMSPGYDPTVNPPEKPTPDEGISTVNGYEALIYRDADGKFLADLNMGSRVRITADGLSENEFLEILDEFTK